MIKIEKISRKTSLELTRQLAREPGPLGRPTPRQDLSKIWTVSWQNGDPERLDRSSVNRLTRGGGRTGGRASPLKWVLSERLVESDSYEWACPECVKKGVQMHEQKKLMPATAVTAGKKRRHKYQGSR